MSDMLNILLNGGKIDLVEWRSFERAESTLAKQADSDFAKAVVEAESEGYLLTSAGKCEIGATSLVWIDDLFDIDHDQHNSRMDNEADALLIAAQELGIDLSGVRAE